ncbi:hypothetical protein Vadar_013792 [Vaccinium darrowii]|uniref:Uncharacterized protein n=1 Tax=Vaccinium darrowii TaxID=229202 RepID=A0ACB7Y0E5_9ERIC|nr:hypothetical protein Vadar_013792 [Vaccinium darrowii]
MGDTAVDVFLETLKQLIRSPQLDSFREEKLQLQALEKEVKYLRGFLKVTEKKRYEHSEVMKLVLEIRDLVYQAEKTIEYILIGALKGKHFTRDSQLGNIPIGSSPLDADGRVPIYIGAETSSTDLLRLNVKEVKPAVKVNKHVEEVKPVVHVRFDLRILEWDIKEKMKTLTTKVKQIYDENIYDIKGIAEKKHTSARSGGGSGSPGGINTAKVVKEKLVVGFNNEVKTLLEKLDDRGEGRPLEIITIIGAGGSGKTTLAREVYDHAFTSHIFEIRAWVDVSQDYDKTTMKRNLLIRVLKSAFPKKVEDYEKSSEDKLGEEVLKCLKGRKYLIVMDDIWDIEAWNDIQRSCPNESNGSKVLFTSWQHVQFDGVRFVSHYLDPLPKDQSWELLQMKVFGMKSCPQELVDIGVKIAEKCGGLPLAIVAIAAFERLRVLSFVSAECQRETEIRNLVLLKYLAVRLPRRERFIALPLISNLLNLETLNLQVWGYSNFIQLSPDIFKMVKLRHLYSKYGIFEYHFCSEEAARIGFDHSSKLDSLQTLHQLCACEDCQSFLVRTPNLRKLGLKQNEKLGDGSFVSLDLEFLKCLETLSITGVIHTECRKLPLTVKRLTLVATFLKWEEVSILQKLLSLEVLKLECNACNGPVWETSGDGFSQLKYLSFDEMDEIEEWNASEDQFPRLEVLVLENCRKLERIPIDFADLNELREIRYGMTTQVNSPGVPNKPGASAKRSSKSTVAHG